jgi:hypothetical protein
MITEENKFFARLLSPHLDYLEEQFRTFGLKPDDFITILHRRLKGKISRQAIKDTLDIMWILQHEIKTATKVKEILEKGDDSSD